MIDVSSPGAASSNQAPPPSIQPGVATGAGKRTLNDTWNEDEAPDKTQKILVSVLVKELQIREERSMQRSTRAI